MTPLSPHIATGCGCAFSSLFVITFMQGIYSYMSETEYIFGLYNFTAVHWLHLVLHVIIFVMIKLFVLLYSTSRYTPAVPTMTIFCTSLMSFPSILLRLFVNLMWFKLPLSLLVPLCFYIPYTLYLYCIILYSVSHVKRFVVLR